jgi:hypothetical protein
LSLRRLQRHRMTAVFIGAFWPVVAMGAALEAIR